MLIDQHTKVYGIIGYPLVHSFSPAMHNAAFQANGINAAYLAFPMKNPLNIKFLMKQLSIEGLSVTIPHKIRVRRSVEQIDPLALQIGSINTLLWNKAGLLTGYNTDGPGAIQAIEESGFSIDGKKVLIIGSGGSARAIAFSLLDKNPESIAIYARNVAAMRTLVRSLKVPRVRPKIVSLIPKRPQSRKIRIQYKHESILETPEQAHEYDLIIQATPMGMHGHIEEQSTPLEKEYLHSHQVLFDIVYNPEITPLVKMAKQKKMGIIPGYKMLLYQGVRQFGLFFDEKAPVEIMEKTLIQELKKSR